MTDRDESGRFLPGNRFWEARSSHGRSPKFESADVLWSACCEYFDWVEAKTFEIGKGTRTPAHIGCRCIRIPVTKSWRELGFDSDELPASTRASMNGQVPDTENYGTWLRKQSAAVQDEALGPTRGKLFRQGGLTVDRFTNRAGDEFTLDELRTYDAQAFRRAGLAA